MSETDFFTTGGTPLPGEKLFDSALLLLRLAERSIVDGVSRHLREGINFSHLRACSSRKEHRDEPQKRRGASVSSQERVLRLFPAVFLCPISVFVTHQVTAQPHC